MKLYESERMKHMFVNVVNELRKETGHKEKISLDKWEQIKEAWKRSTNRSEAKAWIRVVLEW